MNPVGIHFGYWTQYWDVDQLPFVEKARKTGFDILEVRAQKIARMSKAELDALKARGGGRGLGLTYSIGMTEDMDMVSADASVREKRRRSAAGSLQGDEIHGRHRHGRDQL